MPKKVINVSNFSAGLNKNTNSRDLDGNEYQEMFNLDNEVPGKLKLYGDTEADSYNETNGTAITSVNHGNGLYHFNLDKDIASPGTASNREYLAINNVAGSEVKVIDYTSSSSAFDIVKTIDYASINTHEVVMYALDGSLRVVPKFVNTGGTPKILFYNNRTVNFGNEEYSDNLIFTDNAYEVEDLFIAGIRGNYGNGETSNLDPEILYKPNQVFKTTEDSEVFVPLNLTIAGPNSSNRFDYSVDDHHGVFTNYSTGYGSGGLATNKLGGFSLIAYFKRHSNPTDPDNDSDITVYATSKNKVYGLWVSTIYEDNYESPAMFMCDIFQQTGITNDKKCFLNFGMFGRPPITNSRITGYKIYWGIIDNFENKEQNKKAYGGQLFGGRYLFAEIKFSKGIRYAGEDFYEPFWQEDHFNAPGDDFYANWVYPYDGFLTDSGVTTTTSSLDDLTKTINVSSNMTSHVGKIIKIGKESMLITSAGTSPSNFIVVFRGFLGTEKETTIESGSKIYFRNATATVSTNVGNLSSPAEDYTGYNDSSTFLGKEIAELSIEEPYIENNRSIIGPLNTGFNTITIANRRAFIGNLKYYNKDGELVTKNDRIIKSLPNQFDYFEAENFIDVEVEDGDDIVRLASINQQILEFKTRTLFIINISRDIEYLEGTYPFKGCEKDYHVYEGEGFITWFNKNGVYFYDGRSLNDIHLSEKGQPLFDNWDTNYYHDDNVIGFLPKTKEIYIARPDTNILKFDLKSQSWTRGDTFRKGIIVSTVDKFTNFINKNDDTLTYFEETGSNTIELKNWNPTPSAITKTNTVLLKTKEFDFGNPTGNKNINTIYVNYKNGDNIKVQGFGVKRDNAANTSTELALTDIGSLTSTSGAFITTKLVVPDTFKNVVSFGIALELNGTSAADFELNDIQIVYREKVYR